MKIIVVSMLFLYTSCSSFQQTKQINYTYECDTDRSDSNIHVVNDKIIIANQNFSFTCDNIAVKYDLLKLHFIIKNSTEKVIVFNPAYSYYEINGDSSKRFYGFEFKRIKNFIEYRKFDREHYLRSINKDPDYDPEEEDPLIKDYISEIKTYKHLSLDGKILKPQFFVTGIMGFPIDDSYESIALYLYTDKSYLRINLKRVIL